MNRQELKGQFKMPAGNVLQTTPFISINMNGKILTRVFRTLRIKKVNIELQLAIECRHVQEPIMSVNITRTVDKIYDNLIYAIVPFITNNPSEFQSETDPLILELTLQTVITWWTKTTVSMTIMHHNATITIPRMS
jgi:hypothetical protein